MTAPRVLRPGEEIIDAVIFRDEHDRSPVPYRGPVADLVGSSHKHRAEKSGSAFSPAVYKPGQARGKAGVAAITALVFDFDHLDAAAADDVEARLKERRWAWMAYTSHSHQARGEDDACFRVILIPSRAIRPDEFDRVWRVVNAALGGHADDKARDVSRIWYRPSCPAERAHASWIRTAVGRPFDVDRALRAVGGEPGTQKPAARGGAIPPGGRNAHLTRLAGAMRRRGAERESIAAELALANEAQCSPPLDRKEVDRIAASVARYAPASVLVAANHTDLGNAERFEAFAGERFRFVHPWGTWLWYDGTRWCRDADGEAVRSARDALRATAAEAEKSVSVGDNNLIKHVLRSEGAARIAAMLSLAQPLLPVPPERLDADPDLFNCANGTIDLRTGALRPHDRDDLLTRRSPVIFDPDATCPRWEAFLGRVLGGSEGLKAFLQRAVGYSLSGHTHEQVLLLLYGTGANGKSTFLETIRALLGDHAAQADFTTFLKREGEGARNDLARLNGARFVSAVEAEAGKPLAEALIKQLTGGDTITARFLFKEFFDFKPVFKLWLAANHKPTIAGGDAGIWRRIRLVPFTVTIPEAERDPRLAASLLEELPGILAWAVRGCQAWQAEGLGVPDEVRAATAGYREEMDVLAPFLAERTEVASGERVTAAELYQAYEAWCAANGERARSQKGLAAGLRERGFETTRGAKGVRCWIGLRILPVG